MKQRMSSEFIYQLFALLIAVIVIGSLMAVVYIWRIIESAWFGQEVETDAVIREAPVTMLAVIWLAALANIYFGLFTKLPLELATGAAQSLLGQLP